MMLAVNLVVSQVGVYWVWSVPLDEIPFDIP